MKIDLAIKAAKAILMEYWPLNAFIASNPLWSLRSKPFLSAISHANIQGLMSIEYYHACYQKKLISSQDLREAIRLIEKRSLSDDEIQQWIRDSLSESFVSMPSILLADQIDEYQFQKPTVWIKERIFALLRDYFGLNHYQKMDLLHFWHQQGAIEHKKLNSLSAMTVEEAISFLITECNIPQAALTDYLEAIYFQVYGWSSLMHWRNAHPNNPWLPGKDPCESILLIWLSYEYLILDDKKWTYQSGGKCDKDIQKQSLQRRYVWQTAFELHYINHLSSTLTVNVMDEKVPYDAQFIFCIDTRSEGFRRHLEAEGNFQTFGFAGFFGAVFNLNTEGCVSYQAPALVEATQVMNLKIKKRVLWGLARTFKKVMHNTKKQATAPFALFEMAGFWFLPFMLFKTIQPKLKVKRKKIKRNINNTFSVAERFQAAHNLLKSIGLVDNFSPKVLICAHQSDHVNNPFKSSLNCGACGGNSGIPNAIVMCDILNDQRIREKLKSVNIFIPESTQFISACHHTGADRLEILDGDVPRLFRDAIDRAAEKLRKEKLKSLPGVGALSEREHNWSELVPELGLINNASIIIGPRALTVGQDLERRAFLHSYEPAVDQDGAILTSILSAPAIVAHWISSQYYFSTVNPGQFGAGNKAIHNVLPGVGVLEGNLSDLKVGLPLQSTHCQSVPIHEPRRIVVVVCAEEKILQKAIEGSPNFKMLLDNQWVYLRHIERCVRH